MPDPRYPWTVTEGPWFDNNIALCRVVPDGMELTWVTGVVVDHDHDHPLLQRVWSVEVPSSSVDGMVEGRDAAPRPQAEVPGSDQGAPGRRNRESVA